MSKKMIVLVLDGFGIGAMPEAEKANTLHSLLQHQPDLYLPNLEKLGLMNAFGEESIKMKFSASANYGKIALMHEGADTFYGHHEMMGTLPKATKKRPFSEAINDVSQALIDKGYDIKFIGCDNKLLLVNNCITVGDNLEADYGLAYNVTASFEYVSFEEVIKVSEIVRENAKVPRVIAFGGLGVRLIDLISSIHEKDGKIVGVSAPEAGVYGDGYQVIHMGYGIDPLVQAPTILGERGIPVVLIGKVADIVANKYGESIAAVDTVSVMETLIQSIMKTDTGFICANVQETDLAGHDENPSTYIKKLQIVDSYLPRLTRLLNGEDLLMIVADHGNDPLVGHGKHTREYVPLLIFKKGLSNKHYKVRSTLSDIGATAVGFFLEEKLTENGTVIKI